jgi:hypothetical protein
VQAGFSIAQRWADSALPFIEQVDRRLHGLSSTVTDADFQFFLNVMGAHGWLGQNPGDDRLSIAFRDSLLSTISNFRRQIVTMQRELHTSAPIRAAYGERRRSDELEHPGTWAERFPVPMGSSYVFYEHFFKTYQSLQGRSGSRQQIDEFIGMTVLHEFTHGVLNTTDRPLDPFQANLTHPYSSVHLYESDSLYPPGRYAHNMMTPIATPPHRHAEVLSGVMRDLALRRLVRARPDRPFSLQEARQILHGPAPAAAPPPPINNFWVP